MEIVKFVLIFIVLLLAFIQLEPLIETFKPDISKPSFTQESVSGNMYMCKDGDDVPYSCHGQGVGTSVYDMYNKYTRPCPKNWLIKGNSIYE